MFKPCSPYQSFVCKHEILLRRALLSFRLLLCRKDGEFEQVPKVKS